ncbi:MAG: hypothetical protein K2N12_01465 [Helicobacter sp.]|nr:hypothetical protein [Helicobacter sp.]
MLRNVEFYPREERVDIMLAFVEPYNEEIQTDSQKGYTTITFPNAHMEQTREQNIGGTFGIEAIQVAPLDGAFVVIILGGDSLRIQTTKLIEGYGLRLRITQKPSDPLGKLKDTLNDL